MSDSLFQDVADYIRVSNDAIALLKRAFNLLPRRSAAAFAQKLGYQFCRCTYPPQIMLGHEQQKATVCPNPECRRTIRTFTDLRQTNRPDHLRISILCFQAGDSSDQEQNA
jgi:hypothetical protein